MPVSSHILPTYARVDLAFERGEGAWLYTASGERYLDLTSGVATNGYKWCIGTLSQRQSKLQQAFTTIMDSTVPIVLVK